MNYIPFFEKTDILDGGDDFRCLFYRRGGPGELERGCRYPMLFVLQGGLHLRLGYDAYRIKAGNMVVIDAEKLGEYHTDPASVVLVYRPPQRLSTFFGHCSLAFASYCSEIVPILPPLREWATALLLRASQGGRYTPEESHRLRRELARILAVYPPKTLGELYAPFRACMIGDCERCMQEQS